MTAHPPLRILLADDHLMVREGVKRLLSVEDDMEVTAEAASGREALDRAREARPHIALVDVSMPGDWDGVELVEHLRAECPAIRVIALTRHDEETFLDRMRCAGAVGYVLKRSAGAKLVPAIRAVAAGEVYIDSAVRRRAVASPEGAASSEPAAAERDDHPPLTAEEEQVLRSLALSYSTQDIATRLGSTVEHVQAERASALAKIGVTKRIDVVRYARARGWTE